MFQLFFLLQYYFNNNTITIKEKRILLWNNQKNHLCGYVTIVLLQQDVHFRIILLFSRYRISMFMNEMTFCYLNMQCEICNLTSDCTILCERCFYIFLCGGLCKCLRVPFQQQQQQCSQLDAGRRPLCPIHCAKQFPITNKIRIN